MSRLLDLARATWGRIDQAGADPIPAIHAALVQAIDETSMVPLWVANLPPYQRRVAALLHGEPYLSPKTLSEALGIDRIAIGGVLRDMRRRGLVEHIAHGHWRLFRPTEDTPIPVQWATRERRLA